MTKKTNKKKLSIIGTCVSLFCICLIFFVLPNEDPEAQSMKSSTWMSNIKDEIFLYDINIPGTHDSGTRYTAGYVSGIVASCQDKSITQQLNSGIRYLDIRLDVDMDVNHAGVVCYTSAWTVKKNKLTLTKVLDKIKSFLNKNPSETVIIQLKPEGTLVKKNKDYLTELNKILEKYSSNMYSDTSNNKSMSELTMGDVRGKFIVVSRNKHPDGAYRYVGWPDNCTLGNSKLGGVKTLLQDKYEAKTKSDKIACIKEFYDAVWKEENKYNEFIINFVSCMGPYCPEIIAKQINPEFKKYVNDNENQKFGIVLTDVPEDDLISSIYSTNF